MIFLSQLDDASVRSGDDGCDALNQATAVTGWWCFWRWRMRLENFGIFWKTLILTSIDAFAAGTF